MSGKVEKAERSQKVPRDRSKSSKDRPSQPESPVDSGKLEDEPGKMSSPKPVKKSKQLSEKELAVGSVRFEAAEEKPPSREKVRDRTSSAGPILGVEGYTKADTEDSELLMQLFSGMVSQMNGPLTAIVRRNRELKDQIKTLLKAAQTEELPFLGMAREKENLSREYDQMRYEHQILQLEMQQVKQQNAELLVTNQQLIQENAALKEKLGQNDPATNLSALSSGALSISGSSTGTSSSSATASTATTAPSNQPANSSPVVSFTFTRRRDNVVAELEQSILELEEEIKSPRSLNSSHGASDGEKTPTKPKRRITTKSHSNEPSNSQSIVQSSSTPGTSTPTRAKSPPERVVSAPIGSKSLVNSGGSSTAMPVVPMADGSVSPREPASPRAGAASVHKPDTKAASQTSATPVAASSPSPPAAKHISAEDREEARLQKYLNGSRPRSNPSLAAQKTAIVNRLSSNVSDGSN